MQQKITPHLWYDREAKEAAEFYVSVFGDDSKITNVNTIHNTPSGDCDIVSFKLWGYSFMAISAGPLFKFNPSISFIVGCKTGEEVDNLWNKLSENGKVLMPLDKYPFSDKYGWIQDKYGVSWQLILVKPEGDERPKIVPSLLFVKEKSGKAKEARDFYLSVFSSKGGSASGGKSSKEGALLLYEEDTQHGQKKGDVMFSDFMLEGVWIAAMDGGIPHEFNFNEAISLMVKCETQEEIDYYWEKLSTVPAAEQCGWLKDKYGVSWQIVPTAMDEMMQKGSKEQVDRVTQAFLKMKKIDISKLKEAYERS